MSHLVESVSEPSLVASSGTFSLIYFDQCSLVLIIYGGLPW